MMAWVWAMVRRVVSPRMFFGVGIILAGLCLLGLVPNLVMWVMDHFDWLDGPRREGAFGGIRHAVFKWIGNVLLAVSTNVMLLSLFAGPGLLWASVVGLWCWERRNKPTLATPLALLVAVGGNGLIAAFGTRFFSIPAGASVRLMIEALWMTMVSFWTIAAVGGLTLYAVKREGRWAWAWCAVACTLALESFFLGGQLLRWAAALNHFHLAD